MQLSPINTYSSVEDSKALESFPEPSAPPMPEDLIELAGEPSAPLYEEIEATVTKNEPKFEWNVTRLFSSGSLAVRFMSLFSVIPTLILDLGRRVAFSLGLVDGKSFSLIDKASLACQTVASKVNSLFAPKVLTVEEQNGRTVEKMKAHAIQLVAGLEKINGGKFHTNGSFSSPYALEGKAQADQATADLVKDVREYVSRNAHTAEGFKGTQDAARSLIYQALQEASQGKYFVPNKILHSAMPMAKAAILEFEIALNEAKHTFADSFIDLTARGEDFVSGLKKGVEMKVLTEDKAKAVLEERAHTLYFDQLETGVHAAEKSVTTLLGEALKQGLVSRDEALQMDGAIQPNVEELAFAAAKDILRKTATDEEVTDRIISLSDKLKDKGRLQAEDQSHFFGTTKDHVERFKESVREDDLRVQEEAAKIEAERVAELQKAQSQQSLLGKFDAMLNKIGHAQSELTSQYNDYEQLETERKQTAEEFEALRGSKVLIGGTETSILEAASRYYSAVSQISRSHLSATDRKARLEALADEGFTKATINRIQELKTLEPKLAEITNNQAALAKEIESAHDDLIRLRAVYQIYRKNNFKGLESDNKTKIAEKEVEIAKTQKSLNRRHEQVLGKTDISKRLRLDRPSTPVNIDPEGNRLEVEDLIREEEAAVSTTPEATIVGDEIVELPEPRTLPMKGFDYITHLGGWLRA